MQQLAVRQRRQRPQGKIARQRCHVGAFGVQARGRCQEIIEISRCDVRIVRLGLDRDDVVDRLDVANGSGRFESARIYRSAHRVDVVTRALGQRLGEEPREQWELAKSGMPPTTTFPLFCVAASSTSSRAVMSHAGIRQRVCGEGRSASGPVVQSACPKMHAKRGPVGPLASVMEIRNSAAEKFRRLWLKTKLGAERGRSACRGRGILNSKIGHDIYLKVDVSTEQPDKYNGFVREDRFGRITITDNVSFPAK